MKYLKIVFLIFAVFLSSCSQQSAMLWEPEKEEGDEILLHVDQPVYSHDLREAGIEGYVVVQFSVNEKGRVENALIVEEYPQGVFSESAIDSVYSSVYRPKSVNGKFVRVDGKKRWIDFTLKGGKYVGNTKSKIDGGPPSKNATCNNTSSTIVNSENCREL